MKPDHPMLLAIILLLIFLCGWRPQFALAEEAADDQPSAASKFKECFSGDLRVLTYGVAQEPENSSQNPNNDFLRIPRYTADLEVRPDLRFDSSLLELSAKPRAKLDGQIWEEGPRDGDTKWDDDWYVNEWLARVKARENLFVSYGRENLQWGPSFLVSPSNPFFSDNGRGNPHMEVPGMDFGRLVFIPHSLWTISFIVNTDEGRNALLGPDPFEEIYALKIDYTGRSNYGSLIVSQKDDKNTLGFFGGWTVSDAVLLYGEGSLTTGSNALYPQKDAAEPLGASMLKNQRDDSGLKPVILAGGSYTLEGSGTFSLEYLYNGPGYNSDEADAYYSLRGDAAAALEAGGMAGLLGKLVLSRTVNPGLKFLRQNYVMLQYYQTNIYNKLDTTLRWTQNIDEGSGQFLGLLSYSLGNHFELFSSGVFNPGEEESEFGGILNYQLMLGLKYTL